MRRALSNSRRARSGICFTPCAMTLGCGPNILATRYDRPARCRSLGQRGSFRRHHDRRGGSLCHFCVRRATSRPIRRRRHPLWAMAHRNRRLAGTVGVDHCEVRLVAEAILLATAWAPKRLRHRGATASLCALVTRYAYGRSASFPASSSATRSVSRSAGRSALVRARLVHPVPDCLFRLRQRLCNAGDYGAHLRWPRQTPVRRPRSAA
jgi:hypothetical protein